MVVVVVLGEEEMLICLQPYFVVPLLKIVRPCNVHDYNLLLERGIQTGIIYWYYQGYKGRRLQS